MTHNEDHSDIRRHLMRTGLLESDAPSDPWSLFEQWLDQATGHGIHNADAMAVATADTLGRPSVRNVLMRGRIDDGLSFYTNYESQKGVQLTANPIAEVLFSWLSLERQIRGTGEVRRLSSAQSDSYFASRARESQLSAIASPQSRRVGSRDELEAAHASADRASAGEEPIRPANWGGFVVVPERFEFWQGREHRLHDRLVYERVDGEWALHRIAP